MEARQRDDDARQIAKLPAMAEMAVAEIGDVGGKAEAEQVDEMDDARGVLEAQDIAAARAALAQRFLPGREFTVAVLGNDGDARAFPVVEIRFDALPKGAAPLYGYEAKWVWDTTEEFVFFDNFMLAFNLFLGIVGSLTLVVGGIGVSNIMNVVVGPVGASIISIVILFSIMGAANQTILCSPRVYFAMARDGMFFKKIAEVHPKFLTPHVSIIAMKFPGLTEEWMLLELERQYPPPGAAVRIVSRVTRRTSSAGAWLSR